MSAHAKRFPDTVKKIYCSHCNDYVHPRARYCHLQESLPSGSDVASDQPDPTESNHNAADDLGEAQIQLKNNPDAMQTQALEQDGMEGLGGGQQQDPGAEINDTMGHYTYELDSEQSDSSVDSRGTWHHIMPPVSPPQFPVDDHDNFEPFEDDGFQHIAADDYREYDRWYAEDNDAEDIEMLSESLTDEEVDSIIMLAIRQFGSVTQSDYERIQYSYRDKLHLLTVQRLKTRIASLSGVTPVLVDCCINVCHAFTGKYAEETSCLSCNEPRYDFKGRPRQVFQYLPATPRFRAYFNNPELIQKMLYRSNYVHERGQVDDIFDSALYLDLLERNIVIDGVDTGVKYFSGKYDAATAVMTDGIQIFERASEQTRTCWPIMAQNLNLPPAERAQLRNLIPLGVIPGPYQPKDFDSFLVLFVEECIELAKGIEVHNVATGWTISFRMHPLIISGDMQAIKHLENFKGPNARAPCRGCLIAGYYHNGRKTYYVPLSTPLPSDGSSATVQSYDPLNLPLQTEEKTITQTERILRAETAGKADELSKRYGICGPSILDRIPSIQRPSSYPHEFMHLFLLNHGKELVSIWNGSFPGLTDSGSENYLISREDWVAIGKETAEATNLLPSAFIRPLPNIESSPHLYCAESWSFWLVHVGPIVLRGRLPQKYYGHYLELVSILKCLLQLSNTTRRIKQLRKEVAHYVEVFEQYYYQYNYDRLCVCRLTLHALLHVPDDVLRCGPVWVAWSFSIERYCREIVGCAKSKVVPYATINKHVLQMSQLAAVACRFPKIRKAMLFGKADAPVQASRMERIYPEYPDTILRFPCLRGFPLNPSVRRRLASYLHTSYPHKTYHAWLKFIPERCERWGKLRIPDGGDNIRCAAVVDPLSPYGKRDSSMVRYEFEKDRNQNYRNRPAEMFTTLGYARLDFVLALVLPADPDYEIETPTLHILAHITEAKDADGDATTELVSFTHFGRSVIVDVSAIKSAVGRVRTTGVKASGEWYIIDRSSNSCQTVFHPPEHVYEGDEEKVPNLTAPPKFRWGVFHCDSQMFSASRRATPPSYPSSIAGGDVPPTLSQAGMLHSWVIPEYQHNAGHNATIETHEYTFHADT